jgi:hypothetical protein
LRPAITIVALRAVPGLAAIEYVTVPLPVPDVALVTVTHGGTLDTVHGHPTEAVTLTLRSMPPVADAVTDEGEIDDAGKHVAAACVTAKLRPATTRVTLRAPAALAAYE